MQTENQVEQRYFRIVDPQGNDVALVKKEDDGSLTITSSPNIEVISDLISVGKCTKFENVATWEDVKQRFGGEIIPCENAKQEDHEVVDTKTYFTGECYDSVAKQETSPEVQDSTSGDVDTGIPTADDGLVEAPSLGEVAQETENVTP
jgi:hypothetical protein